MLTNTRLLEQTIAWHMRYLWADFSHLQKNTKKHGKSLTIYIILSDLRSVAYHRWPLYIFVPAKSLLTAHDSQSYQLDKIYNHHGNKSLVTQVWGIIYFWLIKVERSTLNVGATLPGLESEVDYIQLFGFPDCRYNMATAACSSCHHSFPPLMNCPLQLQAKINPSFLKLFLWRV